MGYPFKMPKLL